MISAHDGSPLLAVQLWEYETDRLSNQDSNTSHLRYRQQDHSNPDPDRPRQNETWAGQSIQGLQRGFAGRDGVSAQGFLDRDLGHTTCNDDPQCDKAHFGPENCRHNEFARALPGKPLRPAKGQERAASEKTRLGGLSTLWRYSVPAWYQLGAGTFMHSAKFSTGARRQFKKAYRIHTAESNCQSRAEGFVEVGEQLMRAQAPVNDSLVSINPAQPDPGQTMQAALEAS